MHNSHVELKCMLLDMLAWFHAFCQEHNLRYYILCGTMLGAVRHEGFIPWDDDIDIGMPRMDYLRLEQLLNTQDGRYVLETPNSERKDFFYPSAKLYDTQTTLIENTRCKIKRGIYLDIFPLDGTGNSKEENNACFRRVKFLRQLLLASTTGIRRGRSPLKNVFVMVAGIFPDWMLNRKKMLRYLNRMCMRFDYDSCEWVGNLVGELNGSECMPRSIYGIPTKYKFESLEVFGPENYEAYLSRIYGDWRELPPKEKQKSHHDFLYMDLENSYLYKNYISR